MIRTLMVFCCVLMLGLTLTPDMAEAKRFGGGGSFGKMFSTPKKVSPAPKAAPVGGSSKAAATTRRPGMGGIVGGMLAGGLLGAMFFGGAFEGIQMMDILIVAVIAFVLFRLFGGAKNQQRRSPQYAGHPEPEQKPEPAARASVEPLASGGGWGQSAETVELDLPSWFDEKAFLEGSCNHFAQLQQAWSQNDLAQIRSYCSAELFDALAAERARLGEEVLDNDLGSVSADLVGFSQQDNEAQLSVQFNGEMREGVAADMTEFTEIWHLSRDLSVDNADWFIVGIEQVG